VSKQIKVDYDEPETMVAALTEIARLTQAKNEAVRGTIRSAIGQMKDAMTCSCSKSLEVVGQEPPKPDPNCEQHGPTGQLVEIINNMAHMLVATLDHQALLGMAVARILDNQLENTRVIGASASALSGLRVLKG
jgi:hypothetical protein